MDRVYSNMFHGLNGDMNSSSHINSYHYMDITAVHMDYPLGFRLYLMDNIFTHLVCMVM
jgi:hypothetical protein